MTLLADYQARYSTQQRTEWSNAQNSGATTPNTTQEGLAAADGQADFEAICGITYASTNATHVAAGVPLMVERLKLYTGQSSQELYDKLLDRMEKRYRLVLGRNRVPPTTDSGVVPTTEPANARPRRDLSQFGRYIGNAPGGPTVTDPTYNDPRRD